MQITRNTVFTLLAIPSFLSAAQLGETYTQEVVAPTSNAAVEPVLMFSDVSLDEVKSVSAMFTKNKMGTMTNTVAYPCEPIVVRSNEDVVTNMVVRFQTYLGEYSKCVELELSQNGDDIYGRVLCRYYSERYEYRVGDPINDWTASKAYDYFICNVKLFDTPDDNLRTTLYWNGGVWDSTSRNWLDKSGAARAWIPGARACFTNAAAATVVIDAGGVSVSCIQAYGHPVAFTGGTLTMVGSSELVMRTGLARFECPIAGDNGFRVVNRLYKSLLADNAKLTKTAVKFMENASLAGITSLNATPKGSIVGATKTDAGSYHVVSDGQTLTAQMQWFATDWTKCVIVELTQNGGDIYAKWKSAWYHSAAKEDVRGRDFSSPIDISEESSPDNYNLVALRLGARVELAGANTFTGFLHAEGATTVALDGGTLTGGDFTGITTLPNCTLEIAHTRQKFSGEVVRRDPTTPEDYTCSLVVKGTVDPSKNGTRTYSGEISTTSNGGTQTIFQNAGETDISGWIGAEAYFTDDVMGNARNGKAETFFFWNDGMTAKAQFKIADDTNLDIGELPTGYRPYVKAAIYEFSQNGSDIVAKRLSSSYNGSYTLPTPPKSTDNEATTNNYTIASNNYVAVTNYVTNPPTNPVDFMGTDLYDFKVGTDVGSAKYRCKDLTVVVSNVSDTVVTLAATNNTFGKGYITVDGAVLGLASAGVNAEAYYNTVNVKNGGKLFYTGTSLFMTSAKATVDSGSRLVFCRPGTLATGVNLVAKNGSEIVIEGGSITNTTVRLDAAKYNWCSFITLNGGTTLSGGPFAIGRSGDALTVSDADGSGAARIAQSFYIRGSSRAFKFVVPDVSGDDGADLLLDGEIRDHVHTDGPRPLNKTGTGTLRLGASNKRTPALYKDADNITQFGNPESWTGKFTVSEGVLLCGVDEALDGMAGIVLAGGKLDVAGTKTDTGTLTVSQNGEIALGDGGEISFADSSKIAWTSGKALSITGAGRIRFGNSSSALTAVQLSAIKMNGKTVRISSTGYLKTNGLFICIQ